MTLSSSYFTISLRLFHSLCIGFLLFGGSLWARPTTVSVEKTQDDATISLTMEDEFILDDQRLFCKIHVVVVGEYREFEEGDTVTVRLLEDDIPLIQTGDDLLWEVEETITADHVASQRFEQSYDCSVVAAEDLIGGLEIYAQVKVDKESCDLFSFSPCQQDEPSTSNISMSQIEDDNAEEDDDQSSAVLLSNQGPSDRVARDADWLKVEYMRPIELTARLTSNLQGGPLSLILFDEMGMEVVQALEESETELRISSQALIPGQYFLQVLPLNEGDFNFYDLEIGESDLQTNCAPGFEETRPCGLCGQEKRLCTQDGEWEMWGQCENEGECTPGMEEVRSCEEEGTQSRSCNEMCQWTSYSDCVLCEDGATEECYSGPEANRGIGICLVGTRTCRRGGWGSCQGDKWPDLSENCSDGLDNDCDGLTDQMDSDCVGGLGAPCQVSEQCASPYQCLGSPFTDGYCGLSSCDNCTDGVCARALGGQYCLQACESRLTCRQGYVCESVGIEANALACVPPCTSNDDCAVGELCDQFICKTSGMGGTTPPSTPNQTTKPAEEGCQTQSSSSPLWFVGIFILGLIIRRDRWFA
jgi:hypothetical protein